MGLAGGGGVGLHSHYRGSLVAELGDDLQQDVQKETGWCRESCLCRRILALIDGWRRARKGSKVDMDGVNIIHLLRLRVGQDNCLCSSSGGCDGWPEGCCSAMDRQMKRDR